MWSHILPYPSTLIRIASVLEQNFNQLTCNNTCLWLNTMLPQALQFYLRGEEQRWRECAFFCVVYIAFCVKQAVFCNVTFKNVPSHPQLSWRIARTCVIVFAVTEPVCTKSCGTPRVKVLSRCLSPLLPRKLCMMQGQRLQFASDTHWCNMYII